MVGKTPAGQKSGCLSIALAEFEVCCGHVEYFSLTLEEKAWLEGQIERKQSRHG